MTFDSVAFDKDSKDESQLVFSRNNGLLVAHPITDGRSPIEQVTKVVTFTGQSAKGPQGSVLVLKLSPAAINREAVPTITRDGSTWSPTTFPSAPRSRRSDDALALR